jgi:transglutaminase-like putative cysteine protease
MLSVETDRPLYWKASVLDRFDGYRWGRAAITDPTSLVERSARRDIPVGALNQLHPGWVQEARFRVEGLQTDLVIGAGVPLAVTDVDVDASADGTMTHRGGTLDGGSEYAVVTYDPNPTVDQLQSAPARYPEGRFSGATLLALPSPQSLPETMAMPLWGTTNPAIEDRVLSSSYAETYELARAWTATATTPYEAVTAIQTRLGEYAYTPEVAEHEYPLQSFLFEDEAGYCQQFAGSLALMLRMVGIPARVVSGFAPGTPDSSDGSYEVHDYDAHSWVEVFFRGIGWVTFDPTPAAAPAESQRLGGEEPERRGAALLSESGPEGGEGGRSLDLSGVDGEEAGEGGTNAVVPIAVLAVLAASAVAGIVMYRRRRIPMGDPAEAQVAELRMALDRTGWHLVGGTTLLELERRVADAGRRPVAEYVRALRRHRFAPAGSPLPTATQRRAMRTALIAGGPLRRLRAWILVPPGGPRPHR